MSKNVDFDSHDRRRQDVGGSEFIHDLLYSFYVHNNTQFVDELLQRSKTTAGRDSLINALNAGTKTRAQVL